MRCLRILLKFSLAVFLFALIVYRCDLSHSSRPESAATDAGETTHESSASLPDNDPITVKIKESCGNDVVVKSLGGNVFAISENPLHAAFAAVGNSAELGIRGYRDEVEVLMLFDAQENVLLLELLRYQEDGRFIRRVKDRLLPEAWNHLSLPEAARLDVPTVSGATFSSKAIIAAAHNALQRAETALSAGNSPNHRRAGEFGTQTLSGDADTPLPSWSEIFAVQLQWLKIAAAIAGILLALVHYLFFVRGGKKRRLLFLAWDVLLVGITGGCFISLSAFATFSGLNFPNWSSWVIAGMIVLAIALPALFKRDFYCTYLCPLGAAQELCGAILPKKTESLGKARRYLVFLRYGALLGSLGGALLWGSREFLNWELFPALIPYAAGAVGLTLLGIVLFVSLFVTRPYCHFICPTGLLLALISRNHKWRGLGDASNQAQKDSAGQPQS